MQIINLENFAGQGLATGTAGVIYKCLASGKRYYWTGSAFAEYFEVGQGGNITITPLSQALPKASVSDRKAIDTPFSVEPINNVNLITGAIVFPSAATYARAFIAPHTGLYANIETMVATSGGNNIQFGIYSQAGALLGKTTSIADSSRGSGFVGSSFWYDASGNIKTTCGVSLVGGTQYFLALYVSGTSTQFAGFSALPTYSLASPSNPLQAYSASAVPATLTVNGSNQSVFPWAKMEIV
jgi:hypothetical protein